LGQNLLKIDYYEDKQEGEEYILENILRREFVRKEGGLHRFIGDRRRAFGVETRFIRLTIIDPEN
jgi:hypothetical protein